MNRKEAIENITEIKKCEAGVYAEALDMGIRALEAWQKVTEVFEKKTKPVSDGSDNSKERYRYIQWLTDYNAIKHLMEEMEE